MGLVSVIKVSLHFPNRQIFHEIKFQVEAGDRIGLIGPNGSGKTTLLKLLRGEILPSSGEARIAKEARLGYLPQDVQETPTGPLLPSVLDSIPGRVRLRKARAQVEERLKGAPEKDDQEKLAHELAEIHQEMNRLDAEFPPHQAEKILHGLGFPAKEFFTPISLLSGGWKMRAMLASLLHQQPDLLLLDEPTNHLDIPSVRWLDQFLQGFKGAMVLISHDREFLNRQVGRIIALEPEGMRIYNGNYDLYLKARAEERKTLEARARNQDQKIKEAQKFIERFRAKASKARQAQSKIKLVKKLELVETHRKTKTLHFSFPEVARSGGTVLTIKNLSKGFGEKPLYRDVDLLVARGERIAVIGPNGCGKTTLLRMVAGEIEADHGTISLGHGVSMSYFAQHHSEMLDPRKTVIQEVYQVIPDESIGFVRGVCGAFLFSGSDVDKPIGVLSGGERARVALAKILVKPGNFMVMDEPTNHLDLSSSETMIDALENYGGTLLFVSHNQSFINRLATKIWDIGGEQIVDYPGNLAEYYDHLDRAEIHVNGGEGQWEDKGSHAPAKAIGSGPEKKATNKKTQKRQRAEERRQIQAILGPIMAEVERIERRIADLESRQKALERELADPEIFRDKTRSVPFIKEYDAVRSELESLLAQWERNQKELTATREKLGMEPVTG